MPIRGVRSAGVGRRLKIPAAISWRVLNKTLTPARATPIFPARCWRATIPPTGYALRYRDEQADAHGERLLAVLVDRVGRLDEPAEFPLRPRPDHHVECDRRAPFDAFLARVAPGRPGADHDFHGVGERER